MEPTPIMSDPIIPMILKYFVFTLLAVVINMIISVTLSYPLTIKGLPGRNIYKGFLLLVLVIGSGGVHEFLLYNNLVGVHTVKPYIISGIISIINVFVIKSIFNSKYEQLSINEHVNGKSEGNIFINVYLKNIWKPVIGLSVLQFASIWNSFYYNIVYNIGKPSPTGRLYYCVKNGLEIGNNILTALVPVILFLVFRKYLTSEVFVSQLRK